MVLATDMNSHFQQIKTIRALLNLPTSNLIEDKPKALSLILHCCDISHPSKDWSLHSQWTGLLIEVCVIRKFLFSVQISSSRSFFFF